MSLLRPTLHPPVVTTAEHISYVESRLQELRARRIQISKDIDVGRTFVEIPLSTVSRQGMFDAMIDIRLKGGDRPINLIVDSGNSVLILPYWEDIVRIPNWKAIYEILGAEMEPWGCPANVVRGPIDLLDADGSIIRIENCVFYACTGLGSHNRERTGNFGTGRITRWFKSPSTDTTLKPPLACKIEFPVAEFRFAAAEDVLTFSTEPKVVPGSVLRLYKESPMHARFFDIIPDIEWMALNPLSLGIGSVKTNWPGSVRSPIAMIDTGGTCAYLSDPQGYLSGQSWPDEVGNPDWAATSLSCRSTFAPLTIELGDHKKSFTYNIDTSVLPPSVRGLTLVMCQTCDYMRGQNGMNIGGITALFVSILIDYQKSRVGFGKVRANL